MEVPQGASVPPPMEAPAPDDERPPPGTLRAIPVDLLVDVLAYVDVAGLGRAEAAGAGFRRAGAWRAVRAREGLPAAGCPRAAVKFAAACGHAVASSEDFDWSVDGGAVATCKACGRAYGASLALDYVDTRFFSSKLVTRASFVARRPAPRRRRRFDVVWDCAQAEAAKAALAPLGYSIQARARGRSRLRVRGPAERRDLDISKYD